MKREEPQLYEGMYVLSAQLSDAALNETFDGIIKGLEANGGKIMKIHNQGKRRLAYQIGTHKEGHYYLVYFEAPPSVIAKQWQGYKLNDGIVRFMTLRTDKVLEELKFKQLPEV